MKTKVIADTNLPTKLPLSGTLVTWLMLEHFHSPGWVYSVVGFGFAIVWVISLFKLIDEKQVNIIDRIL